MHIAYAYAFMMLVYTLCSEKNTHTHVFYISVKLLRFTHSLGRLWD